MNQTFVRILDRILLTPNVCSYILKLQTTQTYVRGDEMNQTLKRRRRRESNHYKLVAGVLAAAVMLMFLMNVVLSSSLIQGDMDVSGKGYISVTVHSEDTLWSIAESYMNVDYYTYESFIDEVIAMNRIDADTIYAGQEILIPVIASNNP